MRENYNDGCDAKDETSRPMQAISSAGNSHRSIGWAVKQLWDGARVGRRGWNGRDMYLALQRPDPGSKMTQPYVYMKTADGQLVPWLCSQTDLLAMDWEISTYAVKTAEH